MSNLLNEISFANKELLWLLALIPALIVWYILKHSSYFAEMKVASLTGLEGISPSLKQRLRHMPFVFRLFSLILLIVALARPQSKTSWKDVSIKGIDIVMSLDISTSMLAKDFKPDRLGAAKKVAMDFIDSRPNDRVGLVIFAGESFTQCPLTSDHVVVKNLFSTINAGMLANGTAIGNGLATAVTRIKDSKSKSKVVVLLTDGVNNQGSVAPLTAAEIAKTFGIRVYTVGVGTKGKTMSFAGMYPDGSIQYAYSEVKIDEKTLTKIAEKTGGKYFRATDNESLEAIYAEIDRLETTIFEEKSFSNKTERFFPFALLAAAFLFIEFLLKNTYFKRIP